ncbi:hypothetical protein [Chryseobacterium kwangjuense]|uniref:Lipoprotein n=1 Tax=Chryseobacterium kwangjuense TaxID=267125 RepID=A0A135W0G9_9FLAO|nr:hypothetical protein [Chryseobacterium kwangjuense]KXH78259.1 hypothetical protein AU378_22330 [Chryseobacterium kwangjuense]
MKTIFFTAILLLSFSCKKDRNKTVLPEPVSNESLTVTKDTVQVGQAVNHADPIEEIKKEYAVLQGLLEVKKLDSKGFTYNCNEEPSGEVRFYSEKDEIKVIEHFYAEHSHFSATERYFIKNGKPFFIFREETVWNFDGGTPEKPITKDDITETRIYLQNDKPLKCLQKQYSIRSDNKQKNIADQTASKEMKCSVDEVLKTYHSLLENKDKKGEIQCL